MTAGLSIANNGDEDGDELVAFGWGGLIWSGVDGGESLINSGQSAFLRVPAGLRRVY
jgi:hypothetical protein